jgi:hypothetical protein
MTTVPTTTALTSSWSGSRSRPRPHARVYLLLTATRGWTPERWEQWLTPILTASLLR